MPWPKLTQVGKCILGCNKPSLKKSELNYETNLNVLRGNFTGVFFLLNLWGIVVGSLFVKPFFQGEIIFHFPISFHYHTSLGIFIRHTFYFYLNLNKLNSNTSVE